MTISLNAVEQLLADPLAGLPLVPTRRSASGYSGARAGRPGVEFHAIDWSIRCVGDGRAGISHEALERAYVALLMLRPERGLLRVPLRDLVGRPGDGTRCPGGRYRQLRSALDYLTRVRLGPGDLRVIRCWSECPPDPTVDGRIRGPVVVIELDPRFVEGLKSSSAVRLDRRVLSRLRPGLQTGLYRLVCRLQAEHRAAVSALEVFERLGSSQVDVRGARVRQMLGRAHAELVRIGVLADAPEPYAFQGTTWLAYPATELIEGMEAATLLTEIADAYGVTRSGSAALVAHDVEALESTVAAAAIGILVPERTLPGMIVHVARGGEPVADRGRRILPGDPDHLPVEAKSEDARYLVSVARESARRLEIDPRLPADCLARLERQWVERRAARGDATDPWVAEGLALATLQRLLGLPKRPSSRRSVR